MATRLQNLSAMHLVVIFEFVYTWLFSQWDAQSRTSEKLTYLGVVLTWGFSKGKYSNVGKSTSLTNQSGEWLIYVMVIVQDPRPVAC